MLVDHQADRAAVAEVVRVFFAAFTSGPDLAERMDGLCAVFLPGAVIARTCGKEPLLYDVEGFVRPRQALLEGGTLSRFREWELEGRTVLFGDLAAHVCTYAKSWVQDGAEVSGRGVTSLHLVRTAQGWRISAAAWDDQRDGLDLPDL